MSTTDAINFQFVQRAATLNPVGPGSKTGVAQPGVQPKPGVLTTGPTKPTGDVKDSGMDNFMKDTFATVYGLGSPLQDYNYMDNTW